MWSASSCRYLGGGVIKGVGPVTADLIVDQFGEKALIILDRSGRRETAAEGKASGLGACKVPLVSHVLAHTLRYPVLPLHVEEVHDDMITPVEPQQSRLLPLPYLKPNAGITALSIWLPQHIVSRRDFYV